MILHLGGGECVPSSSVLMILAYKEASANPTTGAFLKKFEKGARKRVILDKEIKSIILTEKSGLREIFYSPISSTTLAKRAGRMELE